MRRKGFPWKMILAAGMLSVSVCAAGDSETELILDGTAETEEAGTDRTQDMTETGAAITDHTDTGGADENSESAVEAETQAVAEREAENTSVKTETTSEPETNTDSTLSISETDASGRTKKKTKTKTDTNDTSDVTEESTETEAKGQTEEGTGTKTDGLTAIEILERMKEFSASATALSAAVDLNLDAGFTIQAEDAAETSMNLTFSGAFDLEETADPVTAAMDGTMQISLAGETITMEMQLYMEVSDDEKTLDNYLNLSYEGISGEWVHTRSDLEELLSAYGAESYSDLESMDLTDLLSETEEANWAVTDQETSWLLTAQLDSDQLLPLIQSSLEQEGILDEISMDNEQIAEDLMSSIPVNLSVEVEKDTFAPRKTHVDFNDADLEKLNELIRNLFIDSEETSGSSEDAEDTESDMTDETGDESDDEVLFELTVDSLSDFSVDVIYSYDDVEEILIPAEALLTKVTDAG